MIREAAHELGLDAPQSFWIVDDATLAMMTGGCGPRKFGDYGWFDTIWGLSVKPACSIHDYEYAIGTTAKARKIADNRLLWNMLHIINTKSDWWFPRMLRRYRATTYYNLCVEVGGMFFDESSEGEKRTRPAPWYDVALSELKTGVSEVPGPNHNERILAYHQTTNLKAETDEIPWCSSFVNWCMFKSNVSRTHKATARSWLSWGVEMLEPKVGCVVVFKRGVSAWQGHVGFFAGFDSGGKVLCLGGNQKNKVSIAAYSRNRVLGYRWAELKDI